MTISELGNLVAAIVSPVFGGKFVMSWRSLKAESIILPFLQQDESRGDYRVWIVDGAYVRGHIYEKFTNFGQHYRYTYIL